MTKRREGGIINNGEMPERTLTDLQFRYETHVHTCQASRCGVSTGAEQAEFYHSLGYQGIILTDHFFGGNTAVPRDLSWEDRVKRFCSGYEDALQAGKRLGLDVFFGWEQNYQGDEFLVYGLSPEYLASHPQVETWTRAEQLRYVHEAGGCVVQAHPFRDRDYIPKITLCDLFADGIEAANFFNHPDWDARAYYFGLKNHLPMTAGTDNHRAAGFVEKGETPFATAFAQPLKGIEDFVQAILTNAPMELCVTEDRLNPVIPPAREVYRLRQDETRERIFAPGEPWVTPSR